MLRLGLNQLIDTPTRMSNISANSLLDVIFTNSDITVAHGTLNWNLSDHLAVFVNRKFIPKPVEKQRNIL